MTAPDLSPRVLAFERHRRELLGYATRMVLRDSVAEELVQEAALRLLQHRELPAVDEQLRAWLFRIVTNLAIDHLRRHSTWREHELVDARERGESDPTFVANARHLRGSPEMKAIAREHLAVCFSCTLRHLTPPQAAALLLREVHELSVAEIAEAIDATPIQVKNSLQGARSAMAARFAATCALVNKQGVCHQCVELDGFFNGHTRDPLSGTDRGLRARTRVLRQVRDVPLGSWHRRMLHLMDEVLDA